MSYLLDSHTLLRVIFQPHLLTPKASNALAQDAPHFFSMASLWELTIKRSIGRLDIDVTTAELLHAVKGAGISELPISGRHLEVLGSLPFHHRDPFDRLLIAQAMSEDLVFISKDKAMGDYPVKLLW
jgi:PIN domain nuclease of toxin-antitoxin system